MPLLDRRRQGSNLGVFLLAAQMMNIGIENIPPVTLASVALQVAIFLRLGDLSKWFGYSAGDVCISTYKVWYRADWRVLILSALYHADDLHLYYNMASLLYKGRKLERKFKSVHFAFMLAVFTVMTSVMYVAVNMAMTHFMNDRWYEMTCAVGFSGVLFALKVLVSHYDSPHTSYILGFIPVSSKIVYWAELGIIQLITPNASFTGHLAGILVGLLYIKGPLKILMDSLFPFSGGPSYRYTADRSGYRPFNSGSYRTGSYNHQDDYSHSRYNGGYSQTSNHVNPPQYADYTGGMSEDEQIRRATEESLHQNRGQNQNRLYPDLDELRQRRQNRYQ